MTETTPAPPEVPSARIHRPRPAQVGTDPELEACLARLAAYEDLEPFDPQRIRIEQAVAAFTKSGRKRRRAARGAARSAARAAVIAQTATGADHRVDDEPLDESASPAGPVGLVPGLRCYICKQPYMQVDGFYHQLCPPCAAENRARRRARADLTGRRALVTGGRVKIGYELVLKLLRDGAEVMVTSRFPHDTRTRFAAAPDHAVWAERLTVVPVDLRDPGRVLAWCDELVAEGRPLDILVNNAAQTVRRPPASYAPLLAAERAALGAAAFEPVTALTAPAELPEPLPALAAGAGSGILGRGSGAPALPLDAAGLVPDPSPANSWSRRVEEVDPVELLEVQLVNVTAPFLLVSRLLPLLLKAPAERRYVVNVSAVEGQFNRHYKAPGHPHTNMAKAALNMLTRTSAADLARQGVYMTSVDTGWITDEKPMPDRERVARAGFRTPLDVVDGAARVYDPVVRGENEAAEPPFGCFLKDYAVAPW
ncbi:SDR family oxidoreductase [Yinghuangia seranimata]|uniref:SDR family oxidoreductase n=1 Tax=Yinghuangia seranimata TaxID=408067 RepID=UPI00248C9D4F|nr:SDR family oxidoreductase [Yinghuangia seranimata]MDI2129747.1 SDR family oxidoreductase [Yinghuangia seranimata]